MNEIGNAVQERAGKVIVGKLQSCLNRMDSLAKRLMEMEGRIDIAAPEPANATNAKTPPPFGDSLSGHLNQLNASMGEALNTMEGSVSNLEKFA